MTDRELLDHYRNLYQVVKSNKNDIERELEEYKNLVAMQQDIINSQNKRIDKLTHNINLLLEKVDMQLDFKASSKTMEYFNND